MSSAAHLTAIRIDRKRYRGSEAGGKTITPTADLGRRSPMQEMHATRKDRKRSGTAFGVKQSIQQTATLGKPTPARLVARPAVEQRTSLAHRRDPRRAGSSGHKRTHYPVQMPDLIGVKERKYLGSQVRKVC